MASSAIASEEEKTEYFDSPEELDTKCQLLAEMIMASEHFIMFTGAGISTSTGIPDYRSGYNTVLPTGPGCWETAAKKEEYEKMKKLPGQVAKPPDNQTLRTSISKAYPSATHMAMVELMNQDKLKFVISQNVDGLHRKSGIKPNLMAELHGNTNLEHCTVCGREYMRDFSVRTAKTVHEHNTGRKCDDPNCRGALKDTIINFGEQLNQEILEMGFIQSQLADLHLIMGSSMRVTPACNMPMASLTNGKVVIVNLQKTPVDSICTMQIHGKCDDVMKLVMKKLNMQIPVWQRNFRVKITHSVDKQTKAGKVELCGVDSNGAPYELFKSMDVTGLQQVAASFPSKENELQPFSASIREDLQIDEKSTFNVKFTFFGHYKEPPITVKFNLAELIEHGSQELLMIFDTRMGKWDICLMHDKDRQPIGPVDFI